MAYRVEAVPFEEAQHVQSLVGDNHVGAVPVKVVKKTSGPVTLPQKLKSYYHTIIQLVGALLTLLTVLAGLADKIPGPTAGYIAIAIGFLTAIVTALKSNETWIDNL